MLIKSAVKSKRPVILKKPLPNGQLPAIRSWRQAIPYTYLHYCAPTILVRAGREQDIAPSIPGSTPRRLLRLRLMPLQHLSSHDAAIDVAEAVDPDPFSATVGEVA